MRESGISSNRITRRAFRWLIPHEEPGTASSTESRLYGPSLCMIPTVHSSAVGRLELHDKTMWQLLWQIEPRGKEPSLRLQMVEIECNGLTERLIMNRFLFSAASLRLIPLL